MSEQDKPRPGLIITPHEKKKGALRQETKQLTRKGLAGASRFIKARSKGSVSFGGLGGGGGGGGRKKGMFGDVISGGGAVGWVIAFVMLMAYIYYLSSLSGISPINNSTIANSLGCNTCSPTGGPGGAYNVIKPFGIVFYGSIPLLFAYGLFRRRAELEGGLEPEEVAIEG